jgi:hypothetical protein
MMLTDGMKTRFSQSLFCFESKASKLVSRAACSRVVCRAAGGLFFHTQEQNFCMWPGLRFTQGTKENVSHARISNFPARKGKHGDVCNQASY